MKQYGYCRISTPQQSIDRQERNIKAKYPKAHISKEAYTGTKVEGRKELDKILKVVKPGDTIVFDSVSRMSRNADEGIDLYMSLYEKGITLVFLKEPHINTDTYRNALQNGIDTVGNEIADIYIKATNEVLMILARQQIRQAFEQAEKEVKDLHQRTAEGIQTARLNGKQIGQVKGAKLTIKKKAPAMEQIKKYSKDFDGTLKDTEVMQLVGLARNTYYKYKAELKAEA
ncbi:MAG: recombinase family protein [Lachnospiraceae bacterium]|nr:recombinase family protein [Lachnospiraceae bacterium]